MTFSRSRFAILSISVACVVFGLFTGGAQEKPPRIEIKRVADYKPNGGESIVGTVSGVVHDYAPDKCQCKVVLYAQTNEWYVQPFANLPDTLINSKGEWT